MNKPISTINRILTALYCLGFLAFLSIPVLQMQFDLIPVKPMEEFRKLATFPIITLSRVQNDYRGVVKKYEAWLDDNFGLRNILIRIKNQIDYSLFSVTENVRVGKNGQLFLKLYLKTTVYNASIGVTPDFQKNNAEWLKLDRGLKKKGIRLVVLEVPLPHTIYPELLPAAAPKPPKILRMHHFRDFLKANDVLYVDIEEILRANKDKPLYPKADIHWSDIGACYGARELVNTFAKVEFGLKNLWSHEFQFTGYCPLNFRGPATRFMPLLLDVGQRLPQINKNWQLEVGKIKRKKDGIQRLPDGEETVIYEKSLGSVGYWRRSKDNPFDKGYISQETAFPLIPTMVSVNDSFFIMMETCGLQRYFKKLLTGRTIEKDITGVNAALRHLPKDTKYFIMEFHENRANTVLQTGSLKFPENWPK